MGGRREEEIWTDDGRWWTRPRELERAAVRKKVLIEDSRTGLDRRSFVKEGQE